MNAVTLTKVLGQVAHDRGYRVSVSQAAIDAEARSQGLPRDANLRGVTRHDRHTMVLAPARTADMVHTVAHELAHVILHNLNAQRARQRADMRWVMGGTHQGAVHELEAALTAAQVLKAFGLLDAEQAQVAMEATLQYLTDVADDDKEAAFEHAWQIATDTTATIVAAIESTQAVAA